MNKQEYLQLVLDALYHCYVYYELDASEISDFDYDRLYRKIQNYEIENPNDIFWFSPTQNVGFPLLNKILNCSKCESEQIYEN